MKKYYLVGEKLSHSFSCDTHRFCGLNYELSELSADELEDFLKKKDFDGLNVTIPYKKAVIPFLDEIDDIAEKIGAVNTIVNENGRLKGYNTDYFGLKYALTAAKIELKGKKTLVLGSGGAGVAAARLATDLNAESVDVVSRSGEINYENMCEKLDTQVIINATPVGMFPCEAAAPCDLSRFKKLESVFDCIYNPFRTRLVIEAEKAGLKASGGLKMLVAQGLFSERLWGETNDFEKKIPAVYTEIIGKEVNIVLVGMPGAGKTAIGKIVAKKLQREFFDTDEIVLKTTGRTSEEIITKYGEERFREAEARAVNSLSRVRGAVIATGGGAVLNPENVDKLKSGGVVFYLERDLNSLAQNNRPLSISAPISRLFEQREGYYLAASDVKIRNDKTAEEAAEKIIGEFFK